MHASRARALTSSSKKIDMHASLCTRVSSLTWAVPYNLKKINLALFRLPAYLPLDPVALVLWLQIFLTRKVIASSLRICYSKEGSSTAPWSFFNPWLFSFLFYSLIKGEKLTKEVSIDCKGFRLHHTKTAACTCEHNYETRTNLYRIAPNFRSKKIS